MRKRVEASPGINLGFELMKFTVILPVHNEEYMLRETISSIYRIEPDEVLFALDRCSDKTAQVIYSAQHLFKHKRTKIIKFNERDGEGWCMRGAYLRRELYAISENDTIVNTSADLNLDPYIPEILEMIPQEYALISFGYLDRWTLSTFSGRLHQMLLKSGFGGLLAFSQKAWRDSEDIEDLKKVPQGEDDHLRNAIADRYTIGHVITRSLHLRPNNNARDDYLCGVDTWREGHTPLRRVLYRTIRDLRPSLLVGYLHAKRYGLGGGDLNYFASKAKEMM